MNLNLIRDRSAATAKNSSGTQVIVSGTCSAVRRTTTGQVSSGPCKLAGMIVNVAGAAKGETYDDPSAATGTNPVSIPAAVGVYMLPKPIPYVNGIWSVLGASHDVTFCTEPI